MKNKKRLFALISVAILFCFALLAFASCASDKDEPASESNDAEEQPASEANGGDAPSEQSTTAEPTTPEPKTEEPISDIDATSFLKVAEIGDRNDFTGSLGYEFVCQADVQVVAVGRPINGKMYDPHTIDIWEVGTKTLLASAEVAPDSPRDALEFRFVYLDEPIILKAGESYRIASSEEAGGDWWYDCGSTGDEEDIPDLQPGESGQILNCVFTGDVGEFPSSAWNPGEKSGRGYVGPTFYYVPVS